MIMNFRRIRRCQYVQLVMTVFTLSVVMVCWEQLDNKVVSHVKSYSYRYLVNSYNFLNKSFVFSRQDAHSLSNYNYLINHEHKCRRRDVLLLLFVKTSPENVERRRAIRSTWGNETYIREELGADVRVLFALGVHQDPRRRESTQQALRDEDQKHHDLIQQDFADTFHNLTVKLLLQFHWTHTYCGHARFFMSADDDIFIHMPNMVRYLREMDRRGVRDFWVGRVHRGAPPIRDKASKYYVPYEMYRWSSYPDYTAGAGYVVSGDVASKIYQVSLTINSALYIDDVYMGICASTVGVSPQAHVFFSGEGKAPYHPCIYSKMITSHGHVNDIHDLWKAATSLEVQKISGGLLGRLYCTAVRAALLCKPYYVDTYPCKSAFS